MIPSFTTIARDQVEPLIAQALVAGNDNVFVQKRKASVPNYYWPRAITFFHFDMDDEGTWIQQAYEVTDPDANGDPQTIRPPRAIEMAKALAENARKPVAQQNPAPIRLGGANDTVWKRASYVFFVIDQSAWRFVPSSTTGAAAVVCTTGAGLTPNHSFYDAELFPLMLRNRQTGAPETLPAFFMINHMKDANGQPIPAHPPERFKFSMFVEVPSIPPQTMVWEIDPGGSNEGPPDAPPPPE